MANYTDNFFEIPTKVYDDFELTQAIEQEEIEKTNVPFLFTIGCTALPVSEILSYQDHYEKGRSLEDVKHNGFDCTLIFTKSLGAVECIWKLSKFKLKLNEYITTHPEALEFMKESK